MARSVRTAASQVPVRANDETGVVVARLNGGLGNQLFQAAAAFNLARSEGCAWTVVPPVERRSVRALGEVLPCAVIDTGPGPRFSSPRPVRLLRAAGSRFGVCDRLPAKRPTPEVGWLQPRPALPPVGRDRVILDGYFMHPSWYADHLGEFLDLLRVPNAGGDRATLPEDGAAHVTVSLRRGDYLKMGWDLPWSYYEQALSALPEWIGAASVIGDDLVANRLMGEYLHRRIGLEVVSIGGHDELADLATLVRSAAVITSNSTFAWWGTMLGEHRGQAAGRASWVTYPTMWIDDGEWARVNVIRSAWVPIECRRR